MKYWIKYVLFLSFGPVVIFSLLGLSQNPEDKIIGTWDELSWEYERVDIDNTFYKNLNKFSEYVKVKTGQNLFFHNAEQWIFHPNGTLQITLDGEQKNFYWRLKGRGNILEIEHKNGEKEHYNLTELSEDTLVLNFETSNHIRGIAKFTFKKIDKNVTKI